MARLSNIPAITPAAGGRLMAAGTYSQDSVGAANYVRKVNFRRIQADREGRREGWILFRPNTGLAQGTQAAPTSDKLTLLAENVRPNSEQCAIAASATTIYRYVYSSGTWSTIGSGYSGAAKRWQTEAIDGWLVFNNGVDLPFTYRVEDNAVAPIHELREVGIASVGYITQLNGMLVCGNIVEIQADQLAAVMNGASPYGLVSSSITNHRPYRVIRSEIAQPRNWAPKFDVTMNAASATIVLPFPSTVFVANTTRVAVLNGGPGGGVLGGDSNNPEGILVTGVAGASLTLAVSTDAGLTYPRTVTIMRWADQSTVVGYDDIQDDSSPIIWLKRLGNYVMAYRRTGIFRGRFTGVVESPIEWRQRYKGPNIPKWGEAVADVNGEMHLYPAEGNRFYAFDGENPPFIHKVCDDTRGLFFSGLTPASDVFAVNNQATKEIWFCRPGWTLAYDYELGTAAEIDAEVSAAAYVSRPGWTDSWFILATAAGTVYTYGLVQNAALNIHTFLRNGVNPGGQIKFGMWTMGDPMNEKDMTAYVPLLGSGQADVPIQVKFYGGWDASNAPALLHTEDMALPTKNELIPVFFRAIYFQDEIIIPVLPGPDPAQDADVQLVGRLFQRGTVDSTSVTRNNA
ncbi:MAG: hypothetical protein KIT44_07935 [Opitutaceae bacterium]|nr:hypothetical protein [Opitutaceae bacterium]